MGVLLGSGGGLCRKVGGKEGGKRGKGRWMITEMWWISVGLRAKGPPAPERPFAEQNRASGGALLESMKNDRLALKFQELQPSLQEKLALRHGDLISV